MRKENLILTRDDRKISNKEAALGAVCWSTLSVATILVALTGSDKDLEESNHNDYTFEPTNSRQIEDTRFPNDFILTKLEKMEPQIAPPTPKPAPVPEKAVIDSLDEVLQVLRSHPEQFSDQDVQDISMYYPIYQAASEKYGLDWYLLWIIHKEESTVSFSVRAFEPGHEHYGAMQRTLSLYSKDDVHLAAQGLESLATLPQRHSDDWEEIVWAASKIRADQKYAKSLGIKNILLASLQSYSALGPANYRYELYQNYQPVFED